MIALQLHKARDPNLNAGAFFVPIMRWRDDVWKDRDFAFNTARQREWIADFNVEPPVRIETILDEVLAAADTPMVGDQWSSFQFRGHARAYLNWKRTLRVKSGRAYFRNTRINFMSLVRIPDSHRVFLATDWVNRIFGMTDTPLRQVPREYKAAVNFCSDLPELIIHERLPARCLLWTKDIRLLQCGGKRTHKVKGSRGGRPRGGWDREAA
jgi:hypothetical protein